MKFKYLEVPPDKWTFSPPKVKRFIESELSGRVLNLFAGKTKLNHSSEIVRNDIDEQRDADYHFNATNVDEYFSSGSFDTIILDPPYNVRKSREKYNQELKLQFTIVRDKCASLVRSGGKVISLGYDSTGMSKSRGFEKEKIALMNHKGTHNDTICLIESKENNSISDYIRHD